MPEKETAANDEILRAMQLKKKRRTRFNGSKSLAPAGLPEVDLVGVKAGEVGKPLIVSDGEVKFHDSPAIYFFAKSIFHKTTITKYEKNAREPEFEILVKITDYLLGRTGKK